MKVVQTFFVQRIKFYIKMCKNACFISSKFDYQSQIACRNKNAIRARRAAADCRRCGAALNFATEVYLSKIFIHTLLRKYNSLQKRYIVIFWLKALLFRYSEKTAFLQHWMSNISAGTLVYFCIVDQNESKNTRLNIKIW